MLPLLFLAAFSFLIWPVFGRYEAACLVLCALYVLLTIMFSNARGIHYTKSNVLIISIELFFSFTQIV